MSVALLLSCDHFAMTSAFISHLQGLSYNAGEYEFESGQMVIDRARTWDALLVAAEMNRRYTSYYRFMCEAISVMLLFKSMQPSHGAPGTATKTRFGLLSK